MFNNSKIFSSFSVDNIPRAKQFYGDTLGLPVSDINMTDDATGNVYELLSLNITDSNTIMIYPKPDHLPASFTILNLPVDDIDDAVDTLTRRGINFEHYEGDIKTDEKGISRSGGPLIAWFKDPAGNVLSVLQQE